MPVCQILHIISRPFPLFALFRIVSALRRQVWISDHTESGSYSKTSVNPQGEKSEELSGPIVTVQGHTPADLPFFPCRGMRAGRAGGRADLRFLPIEEATTRTIV